MAQSAEPKKLFLIDAMSLVFRAFHAPMQTALVSPTGLPTKAVYIFVRTLLKLLKDHDPAYLAVAFDLAAPTFRDQLFATYKANRPTFPEDLTVQLPYVRRFCQALGLPSAEKEGFEADDVIGTLAKEGARKSLDVFIVTGDEDMFQLVGPRVSILKPSRGANESETLIVFAGSAGVPPAPGAAGSDETKGKGAGGTPALPGSAKRSSAKVTTVEEVFDGVRPDQVVDWLALCGDPSDNIPGARPLPGQEKARADGEKKRSYIGPKGAADLIKEFGTLENVLANYQKVKKQSYQDALRDFRNEALLSRELATIRTDVPLDATLEGLARRDRDLSALIALCQELGFSTLLREFLVDAPPAVPLGGIASEAEATELRTPGEIEQWMKGLDPGAPISIGLATEGDEGFSGKLAALGFADGNRLASVSLRAPLSAPGLSFGTSPIGPVGPVGQAREAGSAGTAGAEAESIAALRSVLEDASHPKAVHNSKLMRLMLGKHVVDLAGVTEDTLLYAALLEPLAMSDALEEVVLRRRGLKMRNTVAEAAAETRQLAALLAPEVEREGLRALYDDIELPLATVLADVETAGVRIDPAILSDMSRRFEADLLNLTRQIHELAGEPFDIDSPKQLGEILFEKLRLPGGKKLKKSGQYSTVATVLETLAEQHELPRRIIEYRTRAKLKSTYVDALPRYINPVTGRLHTSFNQAGSRTGRLSSSNPNLQNIPIGDEFGLLIRSAFVADPGWSLISADYSQIELRVLAHMSEDPLLIEAFSHGEDIHARTAQEIFAVPPGLQTHEHRRMAKAINYGVIYGLSSFGLAARTGASKTESKQYIDEYFKRYSRVASFLESLLKEARSTGRVRTIFGRFRPIPEINSRDVMSRNRAEREALNAPLQGTAADLMKLAMVKLHARLRREKMQTHIILTVHDELVVEAPDAEVDAAREIVKHEMEGVHSMRVPLGVDVGVGKNWKEAKG
ncbi:MAG TPA: DNA polymerase I [Terriglobia bacterium]|nr:DNA polymerase I [Terriglobia bacterium]